MILPASDNPRMFWWPALTGLTLMALFFTPLRSVDLWWHLDSGRWMLEHGRILDHEVRSFSLPGADWPNFSWLFQVLLAGVDWLAGEWGLLLLKAAMWWSILFLLFRSSTMPDTRAPWAPLLAALLFSWQLFPFMHLRPHLLEGVFLAGSVLLFHRPGHPHSPLLYAVLIVLWANSHASAVVGAAALALHYVIGPSFHIPARRALLRRLPVGLLLWMLVFLTPTGFGILDVVAGHADGEYLHVYIREWFAPETLPPLMFVALAGVAAAALFRRDLLTPAEALLILLFLIISGGSKRFLYELGLLLIRPTSVLLQLGLAGIARREGPRGIYLSGLYGLGLIVLLSVIYHLPVPWPNQRAVDFPVMERRFPHVALNLLRPVMQGEPALRVWNAYGWGGYLGWKSRGRLKIFIDGRTPTVFTEEMMLEQRLALGRPRLLRALLEKWKVDAVVVRRGMALPLSAHDPDWLLVGFDAISVIYLRADLARRYGLQAIGFDPFRAWPQLAPRQVDPTVEHLRRLLASDGDNALAWERLGQLLGYLRPGGTAQDQAGAIEAYERAIALNSDEGSARLGLARLRQLAGQNRARVVAPLLASSGKLLLAGLNGHEVELATLLLDAGQAEKALEVLSPEDWRRHQYLNEQFDVWLLRMVAFRKLHNKAAARFARRMAERLSLDAGPEARQRLESNEVRSRIGTVKD